MAKNLIPEIAKMLGVELGEEFQIDIRSNDIFQITESGIWMKKDVNKDEWVEMPFEFMMLCNGDAVVIKLPWKPKECEDYYTFGKSFGKWSVLKSHWSNHPFDLALLDKGWIFRTYDEAETALPAVAKEMGVEYKLQEKTATCCKNLL